MLRCLLSFALFGAVFLIHNPSHAGFVTGSLSDSFTKSAHSATQAGVAGTLDLTALGTLDWLQFGEDVRKDTASLLIGNVSISGQLGSYNTELYETTWSDGEVPDVVGASTRGRYFQSVGQFSFTVDASPTTTRRLTLIVGGYRSSNVLTASLPDGSIFTDTFSIASPLVSSRVYAIDFRGDSPSDVLSITLFQDPVHAQTRVVAAAVSNAPTTSAVPEPSSLALLGTGALGLFGYGRRRRKTEAA